MAWGLIGGLVGEGVGGFTRCVDIREQRRDLGSSGGKGRLLG